MNFLPVPTKRYSWITALLLATILFLIYYPCLYPFLLEVYKTQFNDGTFLIRQNDEDVRLKPLTIKASVPRYVYQSERIWMYIGVENRGDQAMKVTLYLPLATLSDTILLPSLINDDIYEAAVTMKIKPHSTLVSRIPLVYQANIFKIESIWLQADIIENGEIISLSAVERKSPRGELVPEVNPGEAMKHSFLENILLPPWSNSFLIVMAAFSSYLAQNKMDFKKKENDSICTSYESNPDNEPVIFTADWWKCLGSNIVWAVIVLAVVTLIITMMFNLIALIAVIICGLGAFGFIRIVKHDKEDETSLSEKFENLKRRKP